MGSMTIGKTLSTRMPKTMLGGTILRIRSSLICTVSEGWLGFCPSG
jgi:hypothetical protein